MNKPSQSPHSERSFSLHWLDRAGTWLEKLEPFIPQDGKAAWSWHVSHHQLLTLAKRSEREAGLSILWFAVTETQSDNSETETVLLGALLPGERLALVPPDLSSLHGGLSEDDQDDLHDFLSSRFKLKTVMGTETSLRDFNLLPENLEEKLVERQIPWGKRLTTVGNSSTHRRGNLTTTRRATEADRPLLNRWARLFSSETKVEAIETTNEVAEWIRRGRLLIFETDRPIGMAALSGEFNDPEFGRSCRLSLIFVDPVYRGRGLGHEMMDAIENEARLESVNALVLYSDPESERARRFYSDVGFSPMDTWLEVETDLTP